jgi:hypothetical protein
MTVLYSRSVKAADARKIEKMSAKLKEMRGRRLKLQREVRAKLRGDEKIIRFPPGTPASR